MTKEKKRFNSFVDTSTFEVLNPEFTKATVYIMYADQNRNNSSMSREVIDAALPTLFNVPVVGEFFERENPEDSDFGTHGGKIILDDNGIRYEQTTSPYGVLPSDSNVRWEFKKDKDGVEREYLVADIILWSGRYEELESVFSNENNQSMEISIGDGNFTDEGIFVIDEFNFSALCILGTDVEPCFEGAKIEVFKNSDSELFVEMFSKYQEYVDSKAVETEESDIDTEPGAEFNNEPVAGEPEVDQLAEIFELTYQDKYGLLAKAVKDSEGENWAWVQDFTDSYVEYEVESKPDDEWLYNRYRVSYSLVDEEITLSDDKVEIFNISVTQEEKDMIESTRMELDNRISDLEMQLESMQIEKSDIETELNAYKLDERKVAEDELFEAFDPIFKDSIEYADIKAKKDEFNIDELESQMRILHSKLLSPKFAKKKVRNLTTIKFNKDEKATKNNPYEGLTFNKEEK